MAGGRTSTRVSLTVLGGWAWWLRLWRCRGRVEFLMTDDFALRAARYTERVRRTGWIGNYFLSIGMVGVGVGFGWWEVVAIGLWSGVPGGLVAYAALVGRRSRLQSPGGGGRVVTYAFALFALLALSALGGWVLGYGIAAVLGVFVWVMEFLLAREWLARQAGRGSAVSMGGDSPSGARFDLPTG